MANERNGGPLPDRWLYCPRKAEGLLVDKFFAFKTPLDEKFDGQIPQAFLFSPSNVFQSSKNVISASAKVNERRRLALWIDLTRSKRFYDPQIVEDNDCKYVKIECHGHEGAPNREQTAKFIHVCTTFVSRDPINIVGVHCTHGFNRTGFLLISLLVEAYDWNLEAAVREFARVRPPGIYKPDYLHELYKRYDDANSAPPAPPLPQWCHMGNGGGNNNRHNSNNSSSDCDISPRSAGRKQARFKENPTFMDGVPGADPVTDREHSARVRHRIRSLTRQTRDAFIGSQPVSMDRHNIKKLAEMAYQVSWKADGTRYIMFIANADEIYFVDRDNSVFQVTDLQFFAAAATATATAGQESFRHLTNTLLDGEMVIDKAGSQLYPRFLVYDIMYKENEFVGNLAFPKRLALIQEEIVMPRIEAMKAGRIVREREPFGVRAKSFFPICQTKKFLSDDFARQLGHSPDGLVFQPVDEPYIYGTAENVLKWKPLSMNSIDFKLVVKRVERVGCLTEYVGDLLTNDGCKFASIKCDKSLRQLDGRIIECKLENSQWVFMRERTDKSFANARRTAESVLESIRNPVTEKMLLDFIAKFGWKDPMPPPTFTPPVKRPRII